MVKKFFESRIAVLKKLAFTLFVFALPLVSFAQNINAFGQRCSLTPTIDGKVVKHIGRFLYFPVCIVNNYLIPMAVMAAFIFFMYGAIQYAIKGDSEEERRKGSQFMGWGIIAIFVMFSVWGIIAIIQNTLQIS